MPRECALPECSQPACCVIRVGEKTGDQCVIHGYIVMSQLGGVLIDIVDKHLADKMIAALRTDGYEVAGYPGLSN